MPSISIFPIKNKAVATVSDSVPLSLAVRGLSCAGAVNRITINRKAGYQVMHSLSNAIYYAGFVERACVTDIQGVLYAPCDGDVAVGCILSSLNSCPMSVGRFSGICVEAVESYIAGPVSSFGLRLVGIYG